MSENFAVNLERVINSHGAWQLNKQLATKLSLQPHFSVGDFFKSLSVDDVNFLSIQSNLVDTDDQAAAEMFLMTVLLCMAEGLDFEDETAQERFDTLILFIAAESLHRKGLAEVRHDNMSFGDDMKHTELVRATDAGMELMAGLLGEDPDAS